jgi:hypothetical protein
VRSSSSSKRLPCCAFAAICLAISIALPAFADEPPAKLPSDGWWVRYFAIEKSQGREEWTLKHTFSLVGTTTENDRLCRWVELNSVQVINGTEKREIVKFLVPEQELLGSEKPLDSLVRAWQKLEDGQVELLKFNQPLGLPGFAASADFVYGIRFVIFPGPQQKSKLIAEERVIDFQRGRLKVAEGRSGTFIATRRALTTGQKQTFHLDFTVWNHHDLSPGFVALKSRLELSRDDKVGAAVISEWTVEDFGVDAKSALPDNN